MGCSGPALAPGRTQPHRPPPSLSSLIMDSMEKLLAQAWQAPGSTETGVAHRRQGGAGEGLRQLGAEESGLTRRRAGGTRAGRL